MRDRDLGEQRQLPEMPKRQLGEFEKWAGSGKTKDRERAIKKLSRIGPYIEVPRLIERALIPPLSVDVITAGIKTLNNYVEGFGVEADWGFKGFMGFFNYREWNMERTMWSWRDQFFPWLKQVAPKLSGEQRNEAAMGLVAALRLGPIEFRGDWSINKSLAVVDGIELAASEFADEVVPVILPAMRSILPGDLDDFAAFWILTKVLCEIKDPRSIDFLKERLADAPEMSELGDALATKHDMRKALAAMGVDVE